MKRQFIADVLVAFVQELMHIFGNLIAEEVYIIVI